MCKISCGCSGADLTKDARLFWLQIRKSLGMRYRDGGHRSSAKAGRLSAGNCESSGSQAGSYAETQAGKGRRMQIPDLVLHGSSVFLHIV